MDQKTGEIFQPQYYLYDPETGVVYRKEQLLAAYKNQRERIEHLEAFINRFRAQATKARDTSPDRTTACVRLIMGFSLRARVGDTD